MDSSSKQFGEECSSSESGWTMYIASPMHDDSDGGDDDDGHGHGGGNNRGNYNKHDDSDDSMASDASSHPSHYDRPNDEPILRGFATFNNEDEGNDNKSSSQKKKAKKQMEKKKGEEKRWIDAEGKGSVYIPPTLASSVPASSKVRKNKWMGKGK